MKRPDKLEVGDIEIIKLDDLSNDRVLLQIDSNGHTVHFTVHCFKYLDEDGSVKSYSMALAEDSIIITLHR
jgi:hypothetical protein